MKNRLRMLRKQTGLAQQGLAVRAGVSPSLLVMVERWDYCPSETVRQRLAAALGVSPQDIWEIEADAGYSAVPL